MRNASVIEAYLISWVALLDLFELCPHLGSRFYHSVGNDKFEPSAKVCQVWTDTWLKRGGTWQISASHDNRVECK